MPPGEIDTSVSTFIDYSESDKFDESASTSIVGLDGAGEVVTGYGVMVASRLRLAVPCHIMSMRRTTGKFRRTARAPGAPGTVFAALLSLACLGLTGCDGGAAVRAQLEDDLVRVEYAIQHLGRELDRGSILNAALLGTYAVRIADAKPDVRPVADALAREGTRDGTLYRSIERRFAGVRDSFPEPGADTAAYAPAAEELARLAAAADPEEFNRALADPLNVLADLSEGALPRVDAASAAASRAANAAEDLGPGGQLVGNPNYGEWQTGAGGASFWVWYGQFALIRDLLGGPRIGYGAWARGRDYSYYHDWGRGAYTSPDARKRQAQVESGARRKFASEGKTFRSPYEKRRQGASSRVARQKFAAGQAKRGGTGSLRGFGGGSRGVRRGK